MVRYSLTGDNDETEDCLRIRPRRRSSGSSDGFRRKGRKLALLPQLPLLLA